MKRILLSLLFAQSSCFFAVYGAAAGDSCEESERKKIAVDPKDITTVFLNISDDFSQEKNAYISGRIAKNSEKNIQEIEQQFDCCFKNLECYSIKYKNNVVGVIIANDWRFCRIQWIVIDKKYQGRGIGKVAIDVFAQTCRLESLRATPYNEVLAQYYVNECGFRKISCGFGDYDYVKIFPKK